MVPCVECIGTSSCHRIYYWIRFGTDSCTVCTYPLVTGSLLQLSLLLLCLLLFDYIFLERKTSYPKVNPSLLISIMKFSYRDCNIVNILIFFLFFFFIFNAFWVFPFTYDLTHIDDNTTKYLRDMNKRVVVIIKFPFAYNLTD